MFAPPFPCFVTHPWWESMNSTAFVIARAISQPAVAILRLAFLAASVSTVPVRDLPAGWIMVEAQLWPLGHGDATRHEAYRLHLIGVLQSPLQILLIAST